MLNDPRPQHFDVIDGLRAVAVLSVVLYHLDKRLLPGGFVGVDVFFTISGFVVSLSMSKFRAGTFASFMAEFYARRLLRIAPALIVCLVVSSLVATLFTPQAWLSHANKPTALAAFIGLSNFVLARSWNNYFAPLAEFNPFTHTWSLGVEEQFYLAFPFIFYFLHRGRMAGRPGLFLLGAAVVVSLGICAWWTVKYPPWAFYLLPPRFWELAIGILVFEVASRWKAPLPSASGRRIVMGALFLGAVGTAALAREEVFPFPWAVAPVALTAILIWLTVSWRSVAPTGPLSWPVVVWIGRISYSFYLWHWPVVVMFRWTIGLDTASSRLGALALSLALAAVSYYWIELPCRDLRRTFSLRRSALIAGSLAAVVMAVALTEAIFRNESTLSLSVTARSAVWLPDAEQPAQSQTPCRVDDSARGIEEGSIRVLRPVGCRPSSGRLFVIGDSHAGAYGGLFAQHARSSGSQVHIAWQAGCGMFDLIRPLAQTPKACQRFASQVVTEFQAAAGPGDVLFLPALRIDRFQDQWGNRGLPSDSHVLAHRAAASKEAVALLSGFASRGVMIVFEAPKPVFKAPPFRCSDWFNASNPICAGGFSLSRSEFEERRAEAMRDIATVVAQLPGASVWDPAAVLCSEVCSAFRMNEPLFFDGDHLSGLGNAVLYPDFAATVNARSVRAAVARQ